jgi:YidC/Oxa1 family membrane protein insertase
LKSASRSIALLLTISILIAGLTGCGQKTIRDNYPNTFEDAARLEADRPKEAHEEYLSIRNANDGKNQEKAAEALWRDADFTAHRYVKDLGPRPSAEMVEMQTEGLTHAHEDLKLLVDRYADTSFGKKAPAERIAVERQLDALNAKQFNYRLVDSFVALTGRHPAFSYWFALALIAIVVKGITFPLTLKMYKSQREMQKLAPVLKEVQKKYKDEPQVLQQKTMAVYKEHGVSPFASCMPMLVQLPFMIWVYNTIRLYEYHFANGKFLWVGSSLSTAHPTILGTDLAKFDVPLLILYAASNYFTMRLTPPTDPSQAQQQKTMAVGTTGIMFFMFMQYKWSAAFIFYWLILNIISTTQQYYFVYRPNKLALASGEILPAPSSGPSSKETSNRDRPGPNGSLKRTETAPKVSTSTGPRPKKRRPRP